MKKCFYIVATLLLVVACNSKGGSSVDNIQLIDGTKTKVSLQADETEVPGGINFRTTAPWRATVTDVTPKAISNEVQWLMLTPSYGSAGEHHLTMTLTPNTTDKDRRADVMITCGDASVIIQVEQKGRATEVENPENGSSEGDTPKDEVPSVHSISRIDMKEYTYELDGSQESAKDLHFEFFYNESELHRLEKLVFVGSYKEKDGENSTLKGTTTCYYAHDKVEFEAMMEVNGVASPDYNEKGFIMLDNQGRAVSGEFTSYGGDTPYRTTYEYTYDSDGFLKASAAHHGNDVVRNKLTWEGGNPTKLLFSNPDQPNFEIGVAVTFGSIQNDNTLDLGRFLMLWYSEVGREALFTDGASSFAIVFTDYFGVRSKNLPEVVKSNRETVTLEYTLSEGRPTKITIVNKDNDVKMIVRSEMSITYAKQ